ncbi:hypothetical protein Kfla_5085 [Kribbella flavida DSM 17836]|uniref:Uncharacterized protein n=1 Tax=Kribbella flavida (strain DSM 17836 / JCM 10339 / NBRC 14399) TaxID=479435 RepID=D2Q3H8_KRIFD|nr:hypothetical protein [Kribbella flavida]ADB34101.1 hypothetical protein Kfla_5085 [Kribbella flavida DSM 17836]
MAHSYGDPEPEEQYQRPSYRGFKIGAAFFGWLVALSMTVVLAVVVAAVVGGGSYLLDYTQVDARQRPAEMALIAAILGTLVLTLAFYSGGYVAGRLARFDGKRQGFGVWLLSVLFLIPLAGVSGMLNVWYDLLGQVEREDLPLRTGTLATSTLETGALVTAGAVVLLTLVFAVLGGKAGQRYHDKIDSLLT